MIKYSLRKTQKREKENNIQLHKNRGYLIVNYSVVLNDIVIPYRKIKVQE